MWLVLALVAAAPDVDALVKSRALFAAADFEGALTTLDRALSDTTVGRSRAQLELERARCLSALRRVSDSEASIERALEADPTVSLADDDSTRALRASFVQVKTRLAAEVTVVTEPPGLAVRLDGALVGRAPLTQQLAVGGHQVNAIDEAGTEGRPLALVVAPRQKQTVVLRLGEVARVEKPDPSPAAPWPLVPFAATRVHLDPIAPGVSLEPSIGVLARFFVAEVSVVVGGAVGLGARVGGRLPFASDRGSAHLTLDGLFFFGPNAAPGVGGSVGGAFKLVSWFELVAEGAVRYVLAAPGFRSLYGLASLGVRLRWPAPFDG